MMKIKKALQKIEDQTFGICEVCEEIDIERLKSRPVTELCIGLLQPWRRLGYHPTIQQGDAIESSTIIGCGFG